MIIPRMTGHIIDEETQLCLLNSNHAQDLFTLVNSNRQYLRRWLLWLDINLSVSDSIQYIESVQKQLTDNTGFVYGIWYKKEIVGVIGHNQIDWEQKIAWPGYWIAEKAQGKGIMTNCCRTLINYSFNHVNIERIRIHCATNNEKSRAIPERLNFQQQGTIKQTEWLYDRFVDHVIYEMSREDWIE